MAFPRKSIDIAIGPHAGVARTLFAVSSNATASILVNVTEMDSLGVGSKPVPGGLSGFILLNADGTVPTTLVDPNGATGTSSINNVELYDPSVQAPSVQAPSVQAPSVQAPSVQAPSVQAPGLAANGVPAPSVQAPSVQAAVVVATGTAAPSVQAPSVQATPPTDATYAVTSGGGVNTNTSLNVQLTGGTSTPLQLLVSQIYMTPQTDGKCNLVPQQQNITLANVPTATFTPVNQLGNTNVTAVPVTSPSFSIEPGGTAYITLRANVDIATMNQIVTQVAPVVTPQAINSNDTTSTTPPIIAPLFITTASLPNVISGQNYNQTLSAIGGTLGSGACSAYSWGWSGASGSGTPPGLTLSQSGVISGVPTAPGTYNVLVHVGTCRQESATRVLSIQVVAPLAITTASQLPAATQGISNAPVNFSATGGIGPYNWTPLTVDGMSLNSSGVLSGTPSATGTFPFTATVSDSGPPVQTVSQSMTLNVVPFTPNPTNGGLLFDNWNTAGVLSGPPTATTFYLPSTTKITQIANYHYFNGGALPGTISLQNQNGQLFGPFATVGVPGQGGVANAAWVGTPNIIVPAGVYTVIDSNSATWSYNATFSTTATGQVNCNCGFTRVWGFAVPVLVVINAADTGPGSLRQAILDFNQSSSLVGIIFNIPGSGVQTIGPQTDLPALTRPASLDATTQPGYTGTPIIELNGGVGIAVNGLHITAGNTTVRGFVINRFSGDGILLDTNGGDVIQANYIGTDVTGTIAQANKGNGIQIIDTPNNTIGGTTNSTANVISGNVGEGVRIDGALATGNVVQGNYIGTSASGSAAVGNSASGIYIRRAPGNSVIGNTVSGNLGFAGITICGNATFCGGSNVGTQGNNATGNIVQGNFVGTDASGTTALSNKQAGVSIDGAPNTQVGGTTANTHNIISFNGTNGVQIFSTGADSNKILGNTIASNNVGISVAAGTGNTLSQNSVSGDTGLGIDLAPAGVNLNTSGGAHNFPVITSAPLANGTTTINGTLNGTPSTAYTIEFFSNASCNSSGYGEGATFLGSSTNVGTDGSGNASFSFSAAAPATQSVFTATATDAGGTTSEFSACMPFPAATTVNLTPTSAGATMAGQSFNETRAGDVKVLTTGPLTVSSMTLSGLDIVGSSATSATVGARIYDTNSQALVGSGNVNVNAGSQLTVTIPIAATLASGATYRVGFYVQTAPSAGGGSGTVFLATSFPYTEPTGRFQIVAAWDSSPSGDVFPTTTNSALPQMTITVAP
jgi:parallel beta-helix repeat protein